jgi:ribosome-binding factor A
MTVPGRRQLRLQDQIRTEVTEMIELELRDPRIGSATVTQVELTPDLRSARIWIAVAEKGDAERTLKGLASAAGYLRYELSQRLNVRRVPELTFVLDHTAEEALRIESLLNKASKSK